jgi:hypothetical protein
MNPWIQWLHKTISPRTYARQMYEQQLSMVKDYRIELFEDPHTSSASVRAKPETFQPFGKNQDFILSYNPRITTLDEEAQKFLIAHEIAHVQLGHSNNLGYKVIIENSWMFGMAHSFVKPSRLSFVGSITMFLGCIFGKQIYSHRREYQADKMAYQQYPEGAIKFFAWVDKAERQQIDMSKSTSFWLSHPFAHERLTNLKK